MATVTYQINASIQFVLPNIYTGSLAPFIKLNLSGNNYLVPPHGYPLRLSVTDQVGILAVLPRTAQSVTVNVQAENTANVHLALLNMPTGNIQAGLPTALTPDGAVVTTKDAQGNVTTYRIDTNGINKTAQNIVLAVPPIATNALPSCYVFQMWADGFSHTTPDGINRGLGGSYTIASNPSIPQGVIINSVTVQ